MRLLALASCILLLAAQTALPPNYHTIFSNADVLVMHVHYGAHEFIPMHDHPPVATLYIYLNDSGEVDILHEGPGAMTAHRPPTQTGAMRLAPGVAERHSVQSNSATPSDFLRVEFQHLEFPQLPEAGKRLPAPTNPLPGKTTAFEDISLRITRLLCPSNKGCAPFQTPERSLLVAITPIQLDGKALSAGEVSWLPAGSAATHTIGANSQAILVTFLKPAPATQL